MIKILRIVGYLLISGFGGDASTEVVPSADSSLDEDDLSPFSLVSLETLLA